MDTELAEIAEALAARLQAARMMIAVAESCTGGWLAKVLTDIPGGSGWFDRGFVTYSNTAKRQMLGVPATLLEEHGAVSGQVVAAMVSGALTFSEADAAMAISGVAGPGGGSEEKPVGTVWIGWGVADGQPVVRMHSFDGDREAVRRQAVEMALRGMLERIDA